MIKRYEVIRDCKKPKFVVVIRCQGHNFYYFYHTLVAAIFGYLYYYLDKKRFGTMRFTLREVLITDEVEKE